MPNPGHAGEGENMSQWHDEIRITRADIRLLQAAGGFLSADVADARGKYFEDLKKCIDNLQKFRFRMEPGTYQRITREASHAE